MAEWISVILGFVGVLLVVQPEFLGFSSPQGIADQVVIDRTGLYWALLAGVFYGLFLVATRWAAGVGAPMAQVTMQFLIAAVLLTPFAMYDVLAFGVVSVWLLIGMSFTSVLAN